MPIREEEYERPKGAPMWVVTFTDMISLLLTFFIMILTFSSMEEEKLRQATGSLSGAFGAMSKPGKPRRTEIQKDIHYKIRERNENGATKPSMRKQLVDDAVNSLIQDRNRFNIPIERRDVRDETILVLKPNGDDELYALGTDRLMTRTSGLLMEIARMFKTLPVRISIETHIDSKTPDLLNQDPRELTLIMALSAAEIFLEEGYTPERVSATPRGDFHPVADNSKPLGRFGNRRIEIRVLPGWQEELDREKGGD